MEARGMKMRGLRPARKRKRPPGFETKPGGLKERPAARCSPTLLGVVPSPRGPLTSVFGKGTGVTAPPRPPAKNRQPETKESKTKAAEGAQGRARTARRAIMFFVLAPGRAASAAWRGAERASRTAYQNRSAETLAGLAHPACRPGRLPGAFSVLAHGEK